MSLTRAAFAALYALLQQQAGQIAALTARVQQREVRLGGHSENSHRPPASAGPH